MTRRAFLAGLAAAAFLPRRRKRHPYTAVYPAVYGG